MPVGYFGKDTRAFNPTTRDRHLHVLYTGIDPFSGQEAYVARGMRDRKMQRALMKFFKPENFFTVREALLQARREDLIGGGCDCLIPAQPPKEAVEARRRQANEGARGDHVHTVANPAKMAGYRPGRKSAGRQDRRGTR